MRCDPSIKSSMRGFSKPGKNANSFPNKDSNNEKTHLFHRNKCVLFMENHMYVSKAFLLSLS